MIGLLTGTLAVKAPTHLVVETGGVGYQVQVPLSTLYALPETGQQVRLHIHTHLRDDALQLYGFATPEEKHLFLILIGVSGIGPKQGLNLLSRVDAREFIRAIARGDRAFLARIPGVGKKTADRLLVELPEKIAALAREWKEEAPAPPGGDQAREDALRVLVNLGYKRSQAEEAIKQVAAEGAGAPSLETLIRSALKALGG
ncbi:MAG: Holliday junction branch migration protein RuvA [Nitrospirae bacterium]|nr:Holliday junction branch migration protein RuvA [Nitrospirota bacterium]